MLPPTVRGVVFVQRIVRAALRIPSRWSKYTLLCIRSSVRSGRCTFGAQPTSLSAVNLAPRPSSLRGHCQTSGPEPADMRMFLVLAIPGVRHSTRSKVWGPVTDKFHVGFGDRTRDARPHRSHRRSRLNASCVTFPTVAGTAFTAPTPSSDGVQARTENVRASDSANVEVHSVQACLAVDARNSYQVLRLSEGPTRRS